MTKTEDRSIDSDGGPAVLGQREECFRAAGFLGSQMSTEVSDIRNVHRVWFELADDVNAVLQGAAVRGTLVNRGLNYDPNAIATRLLMRSCGNFQGLIIMAERGMVTEALLLARSLLENAFCMASLFERPAEFVELLRADFEAARREQAKFIVAGQLLSSTDPDAEEKLKEVIEQIGKDPRTLSPKKLATTGPLKSQYLAYQKLSNDAAHPSATSLHRFIATYDDGKAWNYRWGPGKYDEIAFCLSQGIHAALSVAVGFTRLTRDDEHNALLRPLADRHQALPAPHGRMDMNSRAE